MPNAKVRHYTTNDPYRPTASNHIMGIKYDEAGMVLYMSFYNGAKYKYYGVPKGLYDGMMASTGSHGTFFWANIRPKFEGILITEDEMPTEAPRSRLERFKEEARLDVLDQEENRLNKRLRRNEIGYRDYNRVMIAIEKERDTLCSQLEAKGYFDETANDCTDMEEINHNAPNPVADYLVDIVLGVAKAIGMVVIVVIGALCFIPMKGK